MREFPVSMSDPFSKAWDATKDGLTKAWDGIKDDVTGAANPAANYTIDKFTRNLTTFKDTECAVRVVNKSVCNLNNVDISGCTSTTVNCCNDSAVSILTCTSSFIDQSASSALLSVYKTMSSSAQTSLADRLKQYLSNIGGVTSSQQSEATSSISKAFGLYMKKSCNQLTVNEQNATMPSLRLTGCHNDVVNLYNRSDVNIRCAAGAISHLMPQLVPGGGPATLPFYTLNPRTKLYLLILFCVFMAFTILCIMVRISDVKTPHKR